MSVRSVFPPRAVFQSATPADRTSCRSLSVVVRALACVCACMCARKRGAMRCGCVRAGMRTQRNALQVVEVKMAGRKDGGNPKEENGSMRVLRGHHGWYEYQRCIVRGD